MTMAERIKTLRKKHNLNQTGAAMIFHIDKTSWSRIESEQREPSIQLVKAICKEWHVSADYLLFGETDPENEVDLNGLSLSQIHAVKEIVDGLRR